MSEISQVNSVQEDRNYSKISNPVRAVDERPTSDTAYQGQRHPSQSGNFYNTDSSNIRLQRPQSAAGPRAQSAAASIAQSQQFQWKPPAAQPPQFRGSFPPNYSQAAFISQPASNLPPQIPARLQIPFRPAELLNRPPNLDPRVRQQPAAAAAASPWSRVREILPAARMSFQSYTVNVPGQPETEPLGNKRTEYDPRARKPSMAYQPDDDNSAAAYRRDSSQFTGPRRDSLQHQNEFVRRPVGAPPPNTNEFGGPDAFAEVNAVRRMSVRQIPAEAARTPHNFHDPRTLRPVPERNIEAYENRELPLRFVNNDENFRRRQNAEFPGSAEQGRNTLRRESEEIPDTRQNDGFGQRPGNVAARNSNWLKNSDRVAERNSRNVYNGGRTQFDPSNMDERTSLAFERVMDNNSNLKDKNLISTRENTEKKFTPNGDIKPPTNLPSELKYDKSALRTPTKKASPKTPEVASSNSLNDKKKIPMNKVQVGAAPSPNLKEVRSKIGSLENYTHRPGGGKVKIENRKLEWKVQPKIEAKNEAYAPTGGVKKIPQIKLQWNAKSKIGSLDNATHKPGGGDKKIETVKLAFKDKAKPKVGSKDNIKHVAGGGTVKKRTDDDVNSISSDIEEQKLEIKAESKVGSLDNVKHKPGGGDKKIFDDKDYLKQSTMVNEISRTPTSGSQVAEVPGMCDNERKSSIELPSKVTQLITSNKSSHIVKEPSPTTTQLPQTESRKESMSRDPQLNPVQEIRDNKISQNIESKQSKETAPTAKYSSEATAKIPIINRNSQKEDNIVDIKTENGNSQKESKKESTSQKINDYTAKSETNNASIPKKDFPSNSESQLPDKESNQFLEPDQSVMLPKADFKHHDPSTVPAKTSNSVKFETPTILPNKPNTDQIKKQLEKISAKTDHSSAKLETSAISPDQVQKQHVKTDHSSAKSDTSTTSPKPERIQQQSQSVLPSKPNDTTKPQSEIILPKSNTYPIQDKPELSTSAKAGLVSKLDSSDKPSKKDGESISNTDFSSSNGNPTNSLAQPHTIKPMDTGKNYQTSTQENKPLKVNDEKEVVPPLSLAVSLAAAQRQHAFEKKDGITETKSPSTGEDETIQNIKLETMPEFNKSHVPETNNNSTPTKQDC